MAPFTLKTKYLILTILIVPFIYFSSLPAIGFGQVTDTTITPDDLYQTDDIPDPDSLINKGNQLINDVDQADKILNESITIGMLDSLTSIPYFQDYYFNTDTSLLNVYNFPMGHVPVYSDSVYRARIEKLDQETPLDLTYNQSVKSFIELYAVGKRQLMSKILGLKEIYFPMIEEYLDKYDIPLEMKYLAVVESALNPTAGSRAGAKGLWQFMYYTGKLYGLKVTSLTDDRFDPYLATDAACRHLRDLYAMFGDWNLVMAAYNSGSGNVKKAIRRAGGVCDYWAIWPFLPKETRGYVPAFIAVNYVMSYASEHNLYPLDPGILYGGIDTIWVSQPLAFDQISEFLNISKEEIEFLNPVFKSGIIPAYNGKTYSLRLPKDQALKFAENEQSIYNYKSKSGLEKEKLVVEIKKATDRQYHTVRSGESLGLIARKYNVSVKQIQQWNGMKGTMIHPGQQLVVIPSSNYAYVPSSSNTKSSQKTAQTSTATNSAPSTSKPAATSAEFHYVKSGENLAMIAQKYGCSVDNLKAWNNLRNNTIYPKQKLKVSGETALAQSIEPDPAPAKVTSNPENKYFYYTVKKGDTLWDIAQQYKGVSVDDIKRWNNMGNSSKLQVGQKLKIGRNG
ncbi:MAG: LysM peptidoglycan-binding domain-containing protein [Bacteroidales bacterium]|nr:LysM peptidoglycan-binding domain-containing protein [Bacteroidales bacterium]